MRARFWKRHRPPHRFSLVASARWECEDVVEWIEYHRSIGFDHVYLYGNDDDPWPLHKRLLPYLMGQKPAVTYTYWRDVGQQTEMYAHFLRTHRSETEWAMFLDIDEFVVVKGHDDIHRFMKPYEPFADCVYFNWLYYGNNGKAQRDDRSILGSLYRRAAAVDVHTKTIWRTAKVTEPLAREGLDRTGPAWSGTISGTATGSRISGCATCCSGTSRATPTTGRPPPTGRWPTPP